MKQKTNFKTKVTSNEIFVTYSYLPKLLGREEIMIMSNNCKVICTLLIKNHKYVATNLKINDLERKYHAVNCSKLLYFEVTLLL